MDAWGREWTFVDKWPIFMDEELEADSPYPLPGVIACEIIGREQDAQGREVVTIDTELPWHVDATGGETRFAVLPSQLTELDTA